MSKTPEFDQEGYLVNLADWSRELAEQLAAQETLVLTPAHWAFLNYLRDYFSEHQDMPRTRQIVTHLRNQLNNSDINNAYLYHLFSKSPLKQGCKIAGLPKPKRCL